MKKLILLTLTAISITFTIPSKVYAVDITVGASTWYAWWTQVEASQTTHFDPGFFYGPVLAVKINDDFNLTFVYLYGVFDYAGDNRDVKYKRNDADLALNYKLTGYLKAFAGIKYMPYKMTGTMNGNNVDVKHSGIGPGLGLSATYPVTENIFALATLSGFYLWSNEDSTIGNDKHKEDYKRYGLNTNLSLAYYITDWATVVSLGVRYQYYRSWYDTDTISWINNYFYGITLSVTYNFSI